MKLLSRSGYNSDPITTSSVQGYEQDPIKQLWQSDFAGAVIGKNRT